MHGQQAGLGNSQRLLQGCLLALRRLRTPESRLQGQLLLTRLALQRGDGGLRLGQRLLRGGHALLRLLHRRLVSRQVGLQLLHLALQIHLTEPR